jgi:hypothetical protein
VTIHEAQLVSDVLKGSFRQLRTNDIVNILYMSEGERVRGENVVTGTVSNRRERQVICARVLDYFGCDADY